MTTQASAEPIYDVAISFLMEDISLAQSLHAELSQSLNVFFFPRNQEELAGTDGLESMREPFRTQSRLNVVLYRPRWGHTPWTGVEDVAIKESCLHTRYKSLFFLVIEPTNDFPKWLPETYVRLNFADFGLQGAVGAIKARARELGGHFQPMTPVKRAAMLEAEQSYQYDRGRISSEDVLRNVKELFNLIAAEVDDVNAHGSIAIDYRVHLAERAVDQSILLGNPQVGMAILWHQLMYGVLHEHAGFYVREFDGNLIRPPGFMYMSNPKMLNEQKYALDITTAREYAWRKDRGSELIPNRAFATQIVLQFMELAGRDHRGKIIRSDRYS
jgi:hypothetical protein